MPLIEPIIRPPAEANSFLLQVTTGCSANECSFCGAYMEKPFKIKAVEEIMNDIRKTSFLYPDTRRVFLLDGDALAVNNEKLLPVLRELNKSFMNLARISTYANGYNITKRSDKELKELAELRLSLIYIGLESGSQLVLSNCNKPSTSEEMIQAVKRAADANIKSSVIVLLGLGGKKYSKIHVMGTIKALNKMQPRYLSFLSVMLIPGTRLYEDERKGIFEELEPMELLDEMYNIIEGLELEKTIFRSDHASNFLPLKGRFPQDKQMLLDVLGSAIKGKTRLRPEFLRGL
ncbi:MAG: radical SAM protein [bacterium]